MAVVDEKSNITFLTNPCEARNPVVECIPYLPFSSNSFSETSETSDFMGTSLSEKVDKTVTVFTVLKVISGFPDRRCLQDLSLINLSAVGWFLLRIFDIFNFYMVSCCSILFTDFGTLFVFAVGPLLPLSVIFFDYNGNFNEKMAKINKMAKNHFSRSDLGF